MKRRKIHSSNVPSAFMKGCKYISYWKQDDDRFTCIIIVTAVSWQVLVNIYHENNACNTLWLC